MDFRDPITDFGYLNLEYQISKIYQNTLITKKPPKIP